MKTGEIELGHNRPLRVTCAGTTVECVAGTIWITSSGMAGDLFLRAGERYRLPSGIALVEALGAARIVLHPSDRLRSRIFSAVGGFLLSYAHGRTSQYSGIYLRTL
jgi:hypothetical protein